MSETRRVISLHELALGSTQGATMGDVMPFPPLQFTMNWRERIIAFLVWVTDHPLKMLKHCAIIEVVSLFTIGAYLRAMDGPSGKLPSLYNVVNINVWVLSLVVFTLGAAFLGMVLLVLTIVMKNSLCSFFYRIIGRRPDATNTCAE